MGRDQKSTTKLAKDKAPGLNGVPPNALKSLDDENITWLLLLYNQFWRRKSDFYEWNEGWRERTYQGRPGS